MARRLVKRIAGQPGVPGFRQGSSFGKRSVRRLLKRDESIGLSMPEANQLTKPKDTASLTTALVGANNDLVFTAKPQGADGNLVTVTYVDPGGATATLGVVVTGKDIVVNLGRATSAITTTATLLKAAVDGTPAAAALVSVANAPANTGAGLVTAMSKTSLAGGYTPLKRPAGPGLGSPTANASISKRNPVTPTGSGQRRLNTPSLGRLRKR